MSEKKGRMSGLFTMENIVISVLVVILIALVFKYIQMKSNNENYATEKFDNENVQFKSGESKCILYYANWCPHCASVHPYFNEWRDSNEGMLTLDNGKMVKIESYEEKDIPKEDQASIEGFPTIKLKCGSNTVEYSGNRKKDDVLQWIKDRLN